MTALKRPRKHRDPFEAADIAELAVRDAAGLVRSLRATLGMPGGERVVAALLELRAAVGRVVDGQTLR